MEYIMSYTNLPTILTMAYNTGSIAGSTTNYLCIAGGTVASNATEANRQNIVPTSGTVKNFYVATSGAQPAGGGLTFTLRKNSADTSITVTIAASAAAGTFSDTSNSFTVVAGDKLSLKAVNASGSTSATIISASVGIY